VDRKREAELSHLEPRCGVGSHRVERRSFGGTLFLMPWSETDEVQGTKAIGESKWSRLNSLTRQSKVNKKAHVGCGSGISKSCWNLGEGE